MIKDSNALAEKEGSNTLLYVKNVINYIQLKYSEPIKIDTIAMSLGLNRSYLTRLFKEATGYSPSDYRKDSSLRTPRTDPARPDK